MKVCRSCCSVPTGTLKPTIDGCSSLPMPGASVTATQGGSTVFTGSTDSLGQVSFTVTSTATVSFTVTEASGRFNTLTFTMTPVIGASVTTTKTLLPGSLYVCMPCAPGCVYPIKKTLVLTSPSGNTASGTYQSSFGTFAFEDDVPGSPICTNGTGGTGTGTVGVIWTMGGSPCVAVSASFCNSVPTTCHYASTTYPTPFAASGGVSCFSVSGISITCGTPGGFMITGTATVSGIFSGPFTITE